jgi:hypothetical protein
MVIRIEQRNGTKDRYLMLVPSLLTLLGAHWKAVAALDRCSDEYDAAALRVTGRPLSDLVTDRDYRPARRHRHRYR